jgi:lysyl-tRNA synthetase class 2
VTTLTSLLRQRAAVVAGIRRFFEERGFVEVQTPIRQSVVIPEAHVRLLEADGKYLQSSPECSMKLLLSRGCEKIFQICPCFRGGERGRLHLEEFTMLEWYRKDTDYQIVMRDCRELVEYIVGALQADDGWAEVGGIPDKWRWLYTTVENAFDRLSPLTLNEVLGRDCFEEILVEYVEPHLGTAGGEFLYEYPIQDGSLARARSDDPGVAERFELYIRGIEIANGCSELTDPVEQRARFSRQCARILAEQNIDISMPEQFLMEMAAIGSAAGVALGVDRLLMVLTGAESIQQVVPLSVAE